LEIIRKNFIAANNSFTCEACDKKVLPANGTFRNHCPLCLTSKHVDESTPGDRKSLCLGLMPTITCEGSNPDKLTLVQQCAKCDKASHNRTAPDDNKDKIFEIIKNIPFTSQ